MVTASPLAKVWAIAFEGMLVIPLDLLALEDMKFCIHQQCLLERGIPIFEYTQTLCWQLAEE